MGKANIAFSNLRAEMARSGFSIADLAAILQLTRSTVGQKLARKYPLNLNEAYMIQKQLFPSHTIEYLFSEIFDETA